MKTYIYANSQIIAQHTGDHEADRYFYLHDRLGSVRQLIDTSGNVKNLYTYKPFGELYPAPDFEETIENPFKFTGQFYDSEIDQYYLRARQYDPHIARFTARDPVFGKFKEPLTLHVYLYCLNDPINRTDLSGEFSFGDILSNAAISGALGGTFRGIARAAYADAIGLGWKGIAAQGGIGFLEGFAFGFVSGGLASFSAQAIMLTGIKESFSLYFVTGAFGGASAGALEGAFEALFSDASLKHIGDRTIAGLMGGAMGGVMGHGLSGAEGAIGTLGMDQFMQAWYDYCSWFDKTFGEKDK